VQSSNRFQHRTKIQSWSNLIRWSGRSRQKLEYTKSQSMLDRSSRWSRSAFLDQLRVAPPSHLCQRQIILYLAGAVGSSEPVADTPVPRGGIVSLLERVARVAWAIPREWQRKCATGAEQVRNQRGGGWSAGMRPTIRVRYLWGRPFPSPSIASSQTPASLSPTPSARLPSCPRLKMI
jgi:hypothetical protein